MRILAYTDGSYNQASGRFGSGGILLYPDGRKEVFSAGGTPPADDNGRNVNGEIFAAECAIRLAVQAGADAVEIHHDYEGVGRWPDGQWETGRPCTEAYRNAVRALRKKIRVEFVRVKGHSGDKWNDAADSLAKYGCGLTRTPAGLPDGCVQVFTDRLRKETDAPPVSMEDPDGQLSLFPVRNAEPVSASDAVLPAGNQPERDKPVPGTRRPADGVNPRCREAMFRFFAIARPSFRDFASLKTYGLDAYSRLKAPDMERAIGRKGSRACRFALHDPSRYEAALRWVMRGLTPDEAAHKANVDDEIAKNCGRR